MASVKGILVEIGGDTSGLQNALKKVNSSTASLSKELRGINSLLKLDPKNTELLNQKQTVLNESIKTTEEKLKSLQEAKELADKAMQDGTEVSEESYRNLQREIISTENKLKELKVEASEWTKAGNALQEYGDKIEGIGNKVGKLGNTLTKTITTTTTAVATLAISSFNEVDNGADNVIKKTGAVGEAAEELESVYKNVAGSVKGSFEDVGNAVGEINTRFGFTGDVLDEASQKFLKFAEINDTDVNTAVQKVSRYMGDASIESSKYGDVLDQLTSVAQASGISIDTLTEYLTKYGAPMRALGLDTKESIAIFAGWEKAGVNTEIAFSGMKKAIGTWGKEGKDATEEFKKTLEEIQKCPDIASATTKAIEVFGQKAGPDLADAIQGGRFEYSQFLEVLEKSQDTVENTYEGIMDETDKAQISMKKLKVEFGEVGKQILTTAEPAVEDILGSIKELIVQFNKLDPKLKTNIIKYVGLAAAMGPVIKVGGNLISTTGKGITSIGKLCTEVAKVKNGMTVANNATGLLAKGLAALTTPAGLATVAIVASAAAIGVAMYNAEKETKEAFSNMGNSASEFISGIDSANSHLDSFNSTLFASAEEQQKLQEDMDEVQQGITDICKRASDERRDYTQEEITQLDEYFNKLRELKDRELEIQNNIAEAITQQAKTNSETFTGNLEEFEVHVQEWLKTAKEQRDKTVQIIEDGTIQEIALLNQRYTTEEQRKSEAYQNEYNAIIEQKQAKINQAQDEVAQISEIYANEYTERAKQETEWFEKVQGYNILAESENSRHENSLKQIEEKKYNNVLEKQSAIEEENARHLSSQKDVWNRLYKEMSDSEADQLGVWLALQADAEIQGGKLTDENQEVVDTIIASYESMPKETKKVMQESMSGMLKGIEEKEPSLFAKAKGIADGILSRLRKAFDIHSPSKETRKIFKYAMEGAEIGLEEERQNLYSQADKIAKEVMNRFSDIDMEINTGKINKSIIEQNKTIFTTPQIVFNVQELDQAKLEQCFDYINRKFGSAY